MARAAGNSHVYSRGLKGHEPDLELPSVTHIQKFLKDELGFGGMAYWGMKIGVAATLLDHGIAKFEALDDPELEVFYESAKATGWHPNAIRDEAGETGTGAHELLEHAAIGDILVERDGDDIQVTGAPEILAPIRYPEKKKSAQRTKWIADKRTRLVTRGKGRAAGEWWLDNEHLHNLIFPELPVLSVVYGYAGTMDFARGAAKVEVAPDAVNAFTDEDTLEIVDYKSHKPAQGMRKDGSYAEGKGPAYLDDLMQVQAYGNCVREMGIGTPTSYRIVLLQPKPDDNGNWYYEDTRTVPFDLFLKFKAIHDDLCRKPECRRLAQAYARRR